jgi:large subunit ribosomal protein L5
MKQILVDKVTLNIGAGKDQNKLEKGIKLIQSIAGQPPVKTFTKKLTLRKEEADELLKRLLESKDNTLKELNFDNEGNVSFGIQEYIDIPGVKYNPDLGIMGLQVCITLKRKGFRVKSRAIKRSVIPRNHRINREEAIDYMKSNYNVQIGDVE